MSCLTCALLAHSDDYASDAPLCPQCQDEVVVSEYDGCNPMLSRYFRDGRYLEYHWSEVELGMFWGLCADMGVTAFEDAAMLEPEQLAELLERARAKWRAEVRYGSPTFAWLDFAMLIESYGPPGAEAIWATEPRGMTERNRRSPRLPFCASKG